MIARGTASPTTSPAQRHLIKQLDTLEALASYLVAQDEQRRDLLWETADVLVAWVARNLNGSSATPLYKALAQATGSSSRFIRDLVRTARAFPADVRQQYADKAWQWFAECLREGDPTEAAARYADMSVREVRDYRRTNKAWAKDPGYVKLSVTLRPDHVQELKTAGKVSVTTVLPDGHQARVVVTRGPIIANVVPDNEEEQ